ncbi:PapB/FocB family fimbrial expression transcriptional regulator [Escherichia sp. E4742]|uniref:PapB/FocB family fimbrial expression transcriptional regulator n=1 Tax=Escherichia sp. E4742 TaxID=2044467 RepID=UPI0010816A54|nr:PapB/FocB family fimbrial expression transcriptional regulator [Escherichia sp. E4742]EFN6235600.1 transcriptional regulator [Escherichia coli]QCT87606.1 transcriptional regulator [Escherichia sp. E4742]TGB53922.1 transcriptional regulator [Escherichia sp. E4742]TLJ06837.1 transcriptional regulator [Escherichia sp. E4742]
MVVAKKEHNLFLRVNRDKLIARTKQGWLVSGLIPEAQFWLLINASSIRSDKVVNALFDFLVNGLSRKESCARYNVNSGHFSIGLGRLQQLSHTAAKLSVFYQC